MLSGESESIDENLQSWQVVSISPTLIKVELEFKDPLQVSQGDTPDQVVIQAQLSQYPAENKLRLPASVVRSKDITPQIKSKAEAEAYESTASGASNVTIATSAF